MYCPNCGAEVGNGAFCPKCGCNLQVAGAVPSAAAAGVAPQPAPVSPGSETIDRDLYGGFWRRLGAYIIDGLLFAALAGAMSAYMFSTQNMPAALFVVQPVLIVGGWLYYALMESSAKQATLGKLALGLRVTDIDGGRISFGRATGRYFAKIVSSLTLNIGYLMIAFTRRRQGLHDIIADTFVLRRDRALAGAAPRTAVAGPAGAAAIIGVVALVLIVPITGILAAIAIPAYQDYTIRAQVMGAVAEAEGVKDAVLRAVQSGKTLTSLDTAALDMPAGTGSSYLSNLEVVNGVVVLTFGNQATPKLQGQRLVIVPAISGESLAWVCGHAQPADGFEAVLADHQRYTSVPAKYLPRACRS